MGRGAIVLWAGVLLAVFVVVRRAGSGALEDRAPVSRHTLWKVEGGKTPVWLLGSIHVLRRQNYPLERPIEDAFDQAKVVAFEIDLDEARSAARREGDAAARPAARAKPRTLRDAVSPKTHAAVVKYLESAGLPGGALDDLPPEAVATTLVQVELRKLGFDPEWGADAYFYRRAKKYGKTVVPLETVDEQVAALGALSERGSDELLQATLQEIATMRTSLRDLVRAWKGGEVDRLVAFLNDPFHGRVEAYQKLLVDRNARWVPKIEALLGGDAPALVIVGTGHLVGTDSVVAMLSANGYQVTQQ